MANHSPRRDNYVAKKTWHEAMSGSPASATPDEQGREPEINPARDNGGGLEAKTVPQLREIAEQRGVELQSGMNKADIIAALDA